MTTEKNIDWPEDAQYENGNYECACTFCKRSFVGHKRRVICKECWNTPQDQLLVSLNLPENPAPCPDCQGAGSTFGALSGHLHCYHCDGSGVSPKESP